MDYTSQVRTHVQRARQLKRGITSILSCHAENLASEGRDDVTTSLTDFTRQLESIELNSKPHVIGLAGNVSAGKSSFINELLGAKVVSVDDGSTTAVTIEINYIPGNEYRATVHFASVEDIKNDLRSLCEAIPQHGGPEMYSPSLTALVSKLSRLFNFGTPIVPPNPLAEVDLEVLNSEDSLFRWIGAGPKIFTSTEVDQLLQQVEPYIRLRDEEHVNLLPYVVNRVCIEGPFAAIPPGVVLVDTPGLNDVSMINSQRTVDVLSRFDELWFLVDTSVLLSNHSDLAFLSSALINKGLPVQIVSTKVDGKKRDGGSLEAYRTKIRRNLRTLFIAHIRGYTLQQAQQITETTEEKVEIDKRLEKISIEFTGIPPEEYCVPSIGFEYWRGRLTRIGEEKAAILSQLKDSLNMLEQAIRLLGVAGPKFSVPVDQFNSWRQNSQAAIVNIRDALGNIINRHDFVLGVRHRGSWSRVRHWAQFEAIMSPLRTRRGRFDSPAIGLVDVNNDIENEWINATRHIRDDLLLMSMEFASTLQRIVDDWTVTDAPEFAGEWLRTQLRILSHTFEVVIRNGFLGTIAQRVQNYFAVFGVYHTERRTLPSPDEILAVLREVVFVTANAGLETLYAEIENISRQWLVLANPVDNLPPTIRRELNALLNTAPVAEETVVPDICDISCSITRSLFVDPVQTLCGHVVERSAIELIVNGQYRQVCPLCRQSLTGTSLLSRSDILAMVVLYRQHQENNVELEGNWWVTFWRTCCDEYRANQSTEPRPSDQPELDEPS